MDAYIHFIQVWLKQNYIFKSTEFNLPPPFISYHFAVMFVEFFSRLENQLDLEEKSALKISVICGKE